MIFFRKIRIYMTIAAIILLNKDEPHWYTLHRAKPSRVALKHIRISGKSVHKAEPKRYEFKDGRAFEV